MKMGKQVKLGKANKNGNDGHLGKGQKDNKQM